MIFVQHRVNTISELKNCNLKYGIEIDLRSYKQQIILNHEPFEKGILFEEWIKEYRHDCLILNIKEEGIEKEILNILEQRKITNPAISSGVPTLLRGFLTAISE